MFSFFCHFPLIFKEWAHFAVFAGPTAHSPVSQAVLDLLSVVDGVEEAVDLATGSISA